MFAKFITRLFAPLFTSPEFVAAVANAVSKDVPLPPLAALVAQSIDIERLGNCVPVQRLAEYIVAGSVLDYADIASQAAQLISASEVAGHLDIDAIAAKAADNIDLDDVAEKAAENIDVSSVAQNVEKGRDFIKAVAEDINLSDLAGELDYRTLTREIELDYSEIASQISSCDIASEIDLSDIASDLSMSDLASELDLSSLAEEISLEDLAGEIDYAELAKALIAQFVEANEKASKVEVRPSAS